MKNQKGFSVVEGLLILVIVGLIGFVGWYVWQSKNKTDKTLENTTQAQSQPTKSQPQKNTTQASNQIGTIKGQASYPSEGLPSDEEICAQDISNTSTAPICVNVGKTQTINYELTVPVGTYYVYAQLSSAPNYKAYYNEYSKCGNSVDCPEAGHKQYIKVNVAANVIVENVDPGDWYAN